MAASAALWALLETRLPLPSEEPDSAPWLAGLAAWLARRPQAMRSVLVNLGSEAVGWAPEAALVAMTADGGPLAEVQVYGRRIAEADAAGLLGLLRALTSARSVRITMTYLRPRPDCGLLHSLAELPHLADLDLTANPWLCSADLEPLRHATALRRLVMRSCELGELPTALGTLPSLEELELEGNPLGHAPAAAWEPLRRLAGLKRLHLNQCSIARLPTQLGALPGLEVLDICGNALGGGIDAFRPLAGLVSLTRLSLSDTGLHALPRELAGLPVLAHLDASCNAFMGRGAATLDGFAPLHALTNLTYLNLNACRLEGVPLDIGSLCSLAWLDMGSNPGAIWGEAVDDLQHLEGLLPLTALRRVALVRCGLHGNERALVELRARGVKVEL